MTDRLYYSAQRLTEFAATVVALEHDGRHVILDRSAFYPTSGGQPHDIGLINEVAVTDVIDDSERVIHVCAQPLAVSVGATVNGRVHWGRRFDNMQQHTGQHLLSALLADRYGWPTVSVHFGDTTSTIDVTGGDITPEQLEIIERQANELIVEGHAITVSFEDAAAVTGLRKPSDRDGLLRVVTIDGVDRSACGGTHVASTGEIGAMLLRRAERTKGQLRLEFICGLRAVAAARTDAQLLSAAARLFTAATTEVPTLVAAQQQRVTELERDRKRMLGELATYEARAHWDATTPDASGVRHVQLPPMLAPVKEAEPLVQAIVSLGHCTVVATSPTTGGVMFGASDGSGVNAGAVLKAYLATVGGRGGGSPRLAQGAVAGGVTADAVWRALNLSVATTGTHP